MPLKHDTDIMQALNQEGYVFNKLNMTTWQAVSIYGRGSYAISLRQGKYYATEMQGTPTEAQRLQELINKAACATA